MDRKVFPKINTNTLEEFPVPNLSKIDAKVQKEITEIVDTMLLLNKQKHTTTLQEKEEQLNQRISYTSQKIDKLVYELYGLSAEEIVVVEGK